jgi:RNA polymerase sigma factor (sigma-70 family)
MGRTKACDVTALDERTLRDELLARADGMREYIARRIRGRVPAEISADDVLQEVCIAACRYASSYKPTGPGALDHWLMAIMNRKLLDALKCAERLKRGAGDQHALAAAAGALPLGDALTELASPGRTPSRECAAREAADAVRSALTRLGPDRQAAVRMRYFEGQSVEEIARRMQKSKAAVGDLLFRGLRELRGHLGSAARYLSGAGSAEDSGD